MQTNECFTCGGNDFVVTDGAYVCNECGIQSQTIREEQIVFNENMRILNQDDNMVDIDHEITAGSQLEKAKKLLSWECFNFILLGLTKEMIELGAKPSLKIIVLQLWVRYLQCIEAAFTSKKFKKLPKLNTTINNIDCQILYGVENIKSKILSAKTGMKIQKKNNKRCTNKRKSLISNNSSASSVLTASQKKFRITRKLQKIDKNTRDLNNDSVGLSDDVSLLQRSMKSSNIKIKLTKNVKKSLKSMPSKTDDLTVEESEMLFKSGQKCWNKLKYKEKKNMLTIKKIISIIRLALMINNDDIYLSDILRWIHEGHFHVNRVNLFLPDNAKHGIHFSHIVHNSSRNGLNVELAMLLNHLEANQLPDIDFKKLAIRFCEELQLPNEFTNFVCNLLLLSPPNIEFNQVLPDIELKVMTYILFAAKFVFCLDDNSENLSSDFASKVKKSNKIDQILFNWNDYVQYIECRNSVISEYNYLLHKSVYGSNIRNTQVFINDWNIMKPTLPIVEREKLSKDFRDNTKCLLKSLPNIEKKRSYREIPASTKPFSSTLKWIFEYYSMQLSVDAKRILENNFIQTDILYLTEEKRIYELAEECDIPIEINYNKPLHYVEQTNKDPDTKCPKSYTGKTKVYLINQPIPKNKQNKTLNNSYEEKPNTIFLGTGVNYWSVHMSKTLLKTVDTDKINTILKQKLPYSFIWFMKQCCRILDCPLSDMYLELMNLEKTFSTFLLTNEETEISDQNICEDMLSNITL